MTRVDAIRELKIALANDDERRFIDILEQFRSTTAIVLYLSAIEQGANPYSYKAHEWIVKRVGGKTANKLENPFPIIKDVP